MAAALCFALLLWSVPPFANHTPSVIETVQEHLERIAEHGHSHGFEEDLFWTMHGHSHDGADHDHSQVILLTSEERIAAPENGDFWALNQIALRAKGLSQIDRPPRV